MGSTGEPLPTTLFQALADRWGGASGAGKGPRVRFRRAEDRWQDFRRAFEGPIAAQTAVRTCRRSHRERSRRAFLDRSRKTQEGMGHDLAETRDALGGAR